MPLTEKEKHQLDEAGYLVLQDAVEEDFLDALHRRILELFELEADQAGIEFKQEPGCRRLANLADKDEIFRQAIQWPPLLEGIRHVLGSEFKISSVNARSINPHSDRKQPLHADQGAVADDKGYWVCNAVWMLDAYTSENGALRLVPGSHRWRKLPQDELADPVAPHPQEILVTGKRGTVVIINAHLWHGGTANRTGQPRTALHTFFARRDKPQQQYQKKLVRPEVQEKLSQELRWLLALDDPLNDTLCAEPAIRSGFLK